MNADLHPVSFRRKIEKRLKPAVQPVDMDLQMRFINKTRACRIVSERLEGRFRNLPLKFSVKSGVNRRSLRKLQKDSVWRNRKPEGGNIKGVVPVGTEEITGI